MKNDIDNFMNDANLWDERDLGSSPEDVEVASDDEMDDLYNALSLQLISIRLERKLITELKSIAKTYGIGYQPMIRDLLNRFVLSERKMELQKMIDEIETQESEMKYDTEAITNFMNSIKKQA